MPELTACLDCGHRLSTAANACPECKTQYPFGVECCICSKQFAYKDCVNSGGRYSHAACVKALLSVPTKCCLCGATLPVKPMQGNRLPSYSMHDSSTPPEVCGSCGQPNPRQHITQCTKCFLPLFEGNEVVVCKRPEVHYSEHYHPGCAPPPTSASGCASAFSVIALVLLLILCVIEAARFS